MALGTATARAFEPGTTGWTAADLDEPDIERAWFEGRFEIVEGVLTTMAPAYFAGGEGTFNLLFALKQYLNQHKMRHAISTEVDIVLDPIRVILADAVLLSPEERLRQQEAATAAGRADARRTRLLVPPTLIIESVSPGHEMHDRHTKRNWYAEFGVRNYWLLDGYQRTLECLVLEANQYRADVSGSAAEILRPSQFPGLVLNLAELWPR